MRRLLQHLSILLCFLLVFEQSGSTQTSGSTVLTTGGQLDLSSHLKAFHSTLTIDKYRPLHLRYLGYESQNNSFKLLLDKGDYFKIPKPKSQTTNKSQNPKFQTEEIEETDSLLITHDAQLKQETEKLMEYFFIGLSLPNESVWVNLRPDSKDSIIDSELAKTDIGKVFLEADVQLKKDTALYTSPQTKEGRIYWDKLYKKAEELFGYDNITIPTLTRPWIVPGEIIIRETPDNAYSYKATLKVMLEEDYLRDRSLCLSDNYNGPTQRSASTVSANYSFNDPRFEELNTYSTQLIKELIIPKITKDVNTSIRYAKLRQVYYSLILAQWFKQHNSSRGHLNVPYPREQEEQNKNVGDGFNRPDINRIKNLINSGNLSVLTSKKVWNKESYYKEYQESFHDGEYNLKEPVRTPFGQVIRSYFSGGIGLKLPNWKSGSIGILSPMQYGPTKIISVSSGIPNYTPSSDSTMTVSVYGFPSNLQLKIEKEAMEMQISSSAVDDIEELYEMAGKLVSCGAFLQAVPYYERIVKLAKSIGGAAILYKMHALVFLGIIEKISKRYPSKNIDPDNFDQFTPGITYPNRLQATHPYIISLLQTFQFNPKTQPLIVDLGTGYIPITTKELADTLKGLSKVIGVDLFIPSFIVDVRSDVDGSALSTNQFVTGLFDKQGQFVYGFGESKYFITPVDTEILFAIKEDLFEQVKGKINGCPFTFKDKHNNQLIYLPFKQYESENLEFREGGFCSSFKNRREGRCDKDFQCYAVL